MRLRHALPAGPPSSPLANALGHSPLKHRIQPSGLQQPMSVVEDRSLKRPPCCHPVVSLLVGDGWA